jgi:septal ring factor EnvC (AmiA/AmiB activator)
MLDEERTLNEILNGRVQEQGRELARLRRDVGDQQVYINGARSTVARLTRQIQELEGDLARAKDLNRAHEEREQEAARQGLRRRLAYWFGGGKSDCGRMKSGMKKALSKVWRTSRGQP